MTFVIARVIGNELSPRDAAGSKLRALEQIVGYGVLCGVEQYWLLNHLFDDDYRDAVMRLLEVHRQPYGEIVFDPATFAALLTPTDRLRYAINVNHARNVAIRHGQRRHDFTVCLDQDCYFTPDLWRRAVANIQRDEARNDRRYYGLIMKRITDEGQCVELARLTPEEPNVIFRRDADRLFDARIQFGQNDKIELLDYLGFGPRPDYLVSGDRCRTVGTVLHLSYGNDHLERDNPARVRARRESLAALLTRLDAQFGPVQ